MWIDECEADFVEIKELVCKAPILRCPNWKLPFHISIDASQTIVGAVLGQQEDKKPYEIYYVNKNLTLAKLNYTITEKEFLAIIYVVNKFLHYIIGYPIFVHTDHTTIRYLMNKPITPSRITIWLLLIQEFDITIIDKPGKDNIVTHFLSRMDTSDEGTPVEDSFPNEHLSAISTHTLWYADIANFLATGKVPQHLSYREQQRIIHHSARYLFYTRSDRKIRCYISGDGIYDVLKAAHDGSCGGHFVDKQTGHKVLQMGYYWSSIFRDARKYVRGCNSCQRMG